MKIPASIRRTYDSQAEVNARLRSRVDERIRLLQKSNWHYESRIKQLPSFALKVESGRVKNPGALEDFFAATLVVANSSEIAAAEALVLGVFHQTFRRPDGNGRTHKNSDAFPFDDLRLYLSVKDDPVLPRTDLVGVVFELQIKTFLQHAWSIATHDLTYKSDDVDWSKERIAYQIKAMLEHAELSIQEAQTLAASSALALQNKRTGRIREMILLMKNHWSPDALPLDLRRLAENVSELIESMEISLERLDEILHGMKDESGSLPSNLSPHSTVVQGLLRFERHKVVTFLRTPKKKKVLIPSEVELDESLDRTTLQNAIFI